MDVNQRNHRFGPEPTEVLAEGTPSEFEAALETSDLPLVVWSATDGVIVMANQQAAALARVPLQELVGRTVYDFARIPREARAETQALASGGGGFFGTRLLQDASQLEFAAQMWTRAVRVGDQVAAVALVIPAGQLTQPEPDPTRSLHRLYPVAVGAMDRDWLVTAISVEIQDLTGRRPGDVVGRRLHEMAHPKDFAKVTDDRGEPPGFPSSQCSIRLSHPQHGWVKTCWLLSPFDTERWAFAILSQTPVSNLPSERVAELELRLRRIGAEVEAAGILDSLVTVLTPIQIDKLQGLTTRQWEIVTLLLKGKRVPTIAHELYVSQSTVRNHLSAVFRKFGVHSQPELLEALRE